MALLTQCANKTIFLFAFWVTFLIITFTNRIMRSSVLVWAGLSAWNMSVHPLCCHGRAVFSSSQIITISKHLSGVSRIRPPPLRRFSPTSVWDDECFHSSIICFQSVDQDSWSKFAGFLLNPPDSSFDRWGGQRDGDKLAASGVW